MDEKQGDITQLLHAWRAGSPDAENRLFSMVIADLRRIARSLMNRERPDHSLQATELVDQIYFRLVAAKDRDWESRKHFYSIAARAMRQHLIDHARARPNVDFVEAQLVEDMLAQQEGGIETIVTIDALLTQLATVNPEMCAIVEMKYFLGLTDVETANVLGLNLKKVKRTWHDARLWLFERLNSGAPEPDNETAQRLA